MAEPHTKTRHTKTRRRSAWIRILGGLVAVVLVLLVVAVALVMLFPTAGVFSPLRATLTERFLSAALGHPVIIEGPVTFELGPVFRVSGSDIRIARPEGAEGGDTDRLDQGTIGLETSGLIAGRLDLEELTLEGVHLAENSQLVGINVEEGGGASVEVRMIGVVPWIVYLSREADVSVGNVTYSYRNETSGWVFDVAVDDLKNTRDATSHAATFTAKGTVNGKAVTIDNEFTPSSDQGADLYAMTVTVPGAVLKMNGSAPEDPTPTLRSMAVQMDVSSVGDVLELLELNRAIDGTGTLSADVDGNGGLPALQNLVTNVTLKSGLDIQLTGKIDDLAHRKGFDLSLDANWPPGGADLSEDDGLLDFNIEQITAHLSGDAGSLAMADGWITTNLFSGAIPRFGPISATAIKREDSGEIAVDGLHVLAGPADQPTLDLSGQIGNLLQLAQFDLKGDVSIPTATLLRLSTEGDALGSVSGKFAASDASGTAGIDTFDASITGSKLVSAHILLKADQSQPVHSAAFDLTYSVPDYATLASALSVQQVPIGAIAFKGGLSISPDSGKFDGTLSFGKTTVTGDLAVKPESGRPLVTGKVSSPDLILGDVTHLLTVGRDIARLKQQAVVADLSTNGRKATMTPAAKALLNPRIEIEVSAGRVDGGGDSASGVTGQFGFDDGLATAKGVKLRYRAGLFDFDGQMRVREASRPFSVNGRMSNWPLGDVLKDLEIDLPITGVLAATFNIDSSGTTVREAIRIAKGDLYLRLLNGSIGNRMLDLSGLDLPSWLTAESAKTGESKIECFDAKLDFSPGLAILDSAVVETDDVIVTATGRIDFKADTIDIEATPKALRPNLIPIVSPFAIRGKLSAPKIEVKGGVAGRAVAETLALPFNTLGALLGVDKSGPKPRSQDVKC